MLTIKKILCPVDFSEPSLKGLDYAADFANLFQAELTVVYVLPLLPPTPSDPNTFFKVPEYERIVHAESEKELKEIVALRIPKNLNVRSYIGHGNPAKEIVRIAEEMNADLIVIATQGHTGWHHFVMGSVAEKVIRHAHCPVFAVRETRG